MVLPECVTCIEGGRYRGGAFSDCRSLQEVALPATCAAIGDRAFQGCSSLQKIALPATLAAIGDYAFADCSSLHRIS